MFLLNPYVFAGDITPGDISNLIGWWDFSDTSSVTTSGSAITRIDPQAAASSSMFFQQATSTYQPSTTTLNGLNAASFSGDYMKSDGANDSDFTYLTGDFTIVVVFQRASGTSTSNRVLWGQGANAGGATDFISVFLRDGDDLSFNVAPNPPTVITTESSGEDYSTGSPEIAIVRRTSGTVEVLAVDGTVLDSNSASGSLSPVTPIFLGGLFDPPTSFNEQWTGVIGEAVVYKKSVSGSEFSALMDYFTDKWGA